MSRTPILGIDLGTTNSCVAVYGETGPRIIENAEGQRTTPSVVSFLADGKVLVGASARRHAALHPRSTISGIKRLIGRAWGSDEVRVLRSTSPYEIVKAPNGDAWVSVWDKTLSPPEVQAYVLDKLRVAAEQDLGGPAPRAVITVPAYFDEAQRRATRDAAAIAGLEVLRLINEPTAAALAYGLNRGQNQTIAVLDLGGGTFDVTLLRVEDGLFEVLATAGDMLLGGQDFDRAIALRVRDEVWRDHGVDVFTDSMATQRLLDEAEAAKKSLSELDEVLLGLPHLVVGQGGPVTVSRTLGRAELESLSADLVERLVEPCKIALADAHLEPAAIDHVVLVGGMTRAPLVQKRIAELFGKRPARGINPDEAVALGAAMTSAILDGRLTDVVLVDVASHTIGIRAAGDKFVPIVRRATVIPARIRKVFATNEDDQKQVVVEVYQGEEAVASKNRLLARLQLTDLPPGRKGENHIEVLFTVDAGGCLAVTARDMKSGKASKVDVVGGSGLDRTAVKRLAEERRAR